MFCLCICICNKCFITVRNTIRKILKQVWYFARLFVLWPSLKVLALGKNQNKFCFFARLFVPLHIHTRKRQYITNYKILLNT